MRVNRATHIPYSNHAPHLARPRAVAPTGSRIGVGVAALLLVTEFAVVFKAASLLIGGAL